MNFLTSKKPKLKFQAIMRHGARGFCGFRGFYAIPAGLSQVHPILGLPSGLYLRGFLNCKCLGSAPLSKAESFVHASY